MHRVLNPPPTTALLTHLLLMLIPVAFVRYFLFREVSAEPLSVGLKWGTHACTSVFPQGNNKQVAQKFIEICVKPFQLGSSSSKSSPCCTLVHQRGHRYAVSAVLVTFEHIVMLYYSVKGCLEGVVFVQGSCLSDALSEGRATTWNKKGVPAKCLYSLS